ncbi:MAG: AAA family ATPase [Chloroflexota bacterium]|nr:AAA family ATPase [Chloroflexota bacterium]
MDRITLQNYRCFGSEEQSALLAPLTLLVGPNSTGKTSFLALIRALWDVAFREVAPNFREHPYDLGSWDDIVHQPGGRSKPADSFGAEFGQGSSQQLRDGVSFQARFDNHTGSAVPVKRRLARGESRWEVRRKGAVEHAVRFATSRGEWQRSFDVGPGISDGISLMPMSSLSWSRIFGLDLFAAERWTESSVAFNEDDLDEARQLSNLLIPWGDTKRPFAGAPIRSRPRRTYDPTLLANDPEGSAMPSYLANLSRREADNWQLLKARLENFGKVSELFDEINVRSFGTSDGDPFQIQVRKHSGPKYRRRKGPWRNLIDVGYGVSQALPVLTELLRPDGPTTFLLQQPEVHLHPQAQAAFGTLFCQVAAGGRQIIIETHSDYIIDRVRMDVRDGTTDLKPEDVSILYFEPGDLAVKIHSIRLDKAGNVLDAPPGYRQFFTDEMVRSIWA